MLDMLISRSMVVAICLILLEKNDPKVIFCAISTIQQCFHFCHDIILIFIVIVV